MRVDIHEARRNQLTTRVDLFGTALRDPAYRGDPALRDGHICLEQRTTRAVCNLTCTNHQVESMLATASASSQSPPPGRALRTCVEISLHRLLVRDRSQSLHTGFPGVFGRTDNALARAYSERMHGAQLAFGLAACLTLGATHVARAQMRASVLHDATDAGSDQDAGPPASQGASALRGLLASPGFEGTPLKGVYFFPGEGSADNERLYTAHPRAQADLHWNSDPSTRSRVLDSILAAHANTVMLSYWGDDMRHWSPMVLDATSVRGALEAAHGKPILIIPALESGIDPRDPEGPHFRFADDFPYENGLYADAHLAPRVLARLREVIQLFAQYPDTWARMYDRNGQPRYVVYIMGAYARRMPQVLGAPAGQIVGAAFDTLARELEETTGVRIGFTLDAGFGDLGSFPFLAENVGHGLANAQSVLAIQLFLSELRSGRVLSSPPFLPPVDNNQSNLDELIAGKLHLLDSWRKQGLPVIYDVSPGFDGRFVWAPFGTSFWGDNYDYTTDDWRNLQSEHKGRDYVGISFNTWNGYTEGYCAVPTLEHGTTIYDWLTDLYTPDARSCHHVEYQDGKPAHRVAGAICEKWQSLLGSQGALGAPLGSELALERASVVRFLYGSIYASESYGVHEVHGAIHEEYERLGFERSCLGMPISDEQALPDGRISHFERGSISFRNARARASCTQSE